MSNGLSDNFFAGTPLDSQSDPALVTDFSGSYNPFYSPTSTQAYRHTAYVKIWVDGIEVTNKIEPFLISVRVIDSGPWTCEIELDDRDGMLPIPPLDAPLEIYMGWTTETTYRVFNGFIQDVEHGFHRKQGGRRMWVHGHTIPSSTAWKTPRDDFLGDGAPPGQMYGNAHSLSDWLTQVGVTAGANSVYTGNSLAGVENDYWSQQNESALQVFSRLAEQYGAVWRQEGNAAYFVRFGDLEKPTIYATWQDNLIGWRLHPYAARPSWRGAYQDYFDHISGSWIRNVVPDFGLRLPWNMSAALYHLPAPAPNSQAAASDVEAARAAQGVGYGGYGRIMINGEPRAGMLCPLLLKGARPGVDGTYWIFTAEHTWSRQGYITTCEVQPSVKDVLNNVGAAGYDNQTPPAAPPLPPTTPPLPGNNQQ